MKLLLFKFALIIALIVASGIVQEDAQKHAQDGVQNIVRFNAIQLVVDIAIPHVVVVATNAQIPVHELVKVNVLDVVESANTCVTIHVL